MPYRLLEDAPTADVGFVASAPTLEECFRTAADATLDFMLANPGSLQLREQRSLRVENDSLDLALLNFLEELIYYKDAQGLFLRATAVDVRQDDSRWIVTATLSGEPIDPARHQLSGDVKAVTVHQLKVQRSSDGWEATVVLDV